MLDSTTLAGLYLPSWKASITRGIQMEEELVGSCGQPMAKRGSNLLQKLQRLREVITHCRGSPRLKLLSCSYKRSTAQKAPDLFPYLAWIWKQFGCFYLPQTVINILQKFSQIPLPHPMGLSANSPQFLISSSPSS